MKQKNLAMLGVAVGCGLVAAVAVAKLSASGTKQQDTAKVLVAKKDLPVQTSLDEKELENLVVWADMPKNLVPPDACTDLEQVKGKTLGRTLRQGNPVTASDLGKIDVLIIPDGCKALTVKCTPVDAVAGFAKPGSKVDVMYVEKMGTGKTRAGIILKDMLLLALNQVNRVDEKTGVAIPQVESATLAVTDKQAQMITLADEKGKLKLMLRDKNQAPSKPLGDGEIEWLTDPFEAKDTTVVAPPPAPKLDTAVVARKAVPVNTLINSDNVNEFFTTMEVKTAPEGVVRNTDDMKGRYIVKPVSEGQYLFKSLTGNEMAKIEKPVEKPEATAPVPMATNPQPTPAKPDKADVAEKEKKKLPRFEQVIQAGGQARKVIWMEVAPEKWKRFDTERDADAFVPDADDPKKDEKDDKAGGPKADQ